MTMREGGGWKLLGNFVGQNTREGQDFFLKKPAWATYLKVRFLTHYGSDFFCTVSSLKVFGTNMLEDMSKDIGHKKSDSQAERDKESGKSKEKDDADAAAKARRLASSGGGNAAADGALMLRAIGSGGGGGGATGGSAMPLLRPGALSPALHPASNGADDCSSSGSGCTTPNGQQAGVDGGGVGVELGEFLSAAGPMTIAFVDSNESCDPLWYVVDASETQQQQQQQQQHAGGGSATSTSAMAQDGGNSPAASSPEAAAAAAASEGTAHSSSSVTSVAASLQKLYTLEGQVIPPDPELAAASLSAALEQANEALALAAEMAENQGMDENPFRAMTNKIRVLELNHSATMLMVTHFGAQNALLLQEVQRTQAARDEAVGAAQALLSKHTERTQAAYETLRSTVQKDAAEIFQSVQEVVSVQVAANVTSQLASLQASLQASHAEAQADMLQRLEHCMLLTSAALCASFVLGLYTCCWAGRPAGAARTVSGGGGGYGGGVLLPTTLSTDDDEPLHTTIAANLLQAHPLCRSGSMSSPRMQRHMERRLTTPPQQQSQQQLYPFVKSMSGELPGGGANGGAHDGSMAVHPLVKSVTDGDIRGLLLAGIRPEPYYDAVNSALEQVGCPTDQEEPLAGDGMVRGGASDGSRSDDEASTQRNR